MCFLQWQRVSQLVYEKYKNLQPEDMKERIDGNHFAILVVQYTNDFFGVENYVNKKNIVRYKSIKDDLVYSYNTAYLRRSSVLTEVLSKFIMRAFDCGLIDIWDRQAVYSEIGTPLQRYLNSRIRYEKHPSTLTVEHLLSIFLVWVCGMLIATGVFLCEISLARDIFSQEIKSMHFLKL